MDDLKKKNLNILGKQALHFIRRIFLPFFLIILFIYIFNYYLSIDLFHWSEDTQFRVDYIIVVIGLLIVGGGVAILFIHFFLGFIYLIGIYRLDFKEFESRSGFFIQDFIFSIMIMLLIEVPFWLYYHSTTYLFSNLLSSFVFSLYFILCWKDNIIRKNQQPDLQDVKVSLKLLLKTTFQIFLLIFILELGSVIYITWKDTIQYFNSL